MHGVSIRDQLCSRPILRSIIWDNLSPRQQALLQSLACESLLILATEHHLSSSSDIPDLLFKLSSAQLSRFLQSFISSGYISKHDTSLSFLKNTYKDILRYFPLSIPKNHLWLEADSVLGDYLSFFISSTAIAADFHRPNIISRSLQLFETHTGLRSQIEEPIYLSKAILDLMSKCHYIATEIGFISREKNSHLKLLFSPSIDNHNLLDSSKSPLDEYLSIYGALSDTNLPIVLSNDSSIADILALTPVDHYNISLSIHPTEITVDLEVLPPEFQYSGLSIEKVELIDAFWQNLNSAIPSRLLSHLYQNNWLDIVAQELRVDNSIFLYPHHFKISLSRPSPTTHVKIYQLINL